MSLRQGSLGPIEQRTLSDIVTARMRQAIIQGDLEPGLRLTEPNLASSLGVSRSPVREAITRLRSEGLIVGATTNYVWKPKRRDVDEIFSLRTAYECLAAEWVIRGDRLSERDYDRLQAQIDRLAEIMEDPDSLSSISLIEADEEFHGYICRKSGHKRLNELWKRNIARRRILMHCCIRSRDRLKTAKRMSAGHQFILDQLRNGNLARVQARHREVNERRAARIKANLVASCRVNRPDVKE
jgi:DNA-binding GntR family transcriptional regulator